MKTLKLALALGFAVLLALPSLAAPSAEESENVYNYLQLLRSDFNSAKVQIINRIMKLSDEDAKQFWPIYREYETELANLAVNRLELISEFVRSHKDGTFNDPKAKDIAQKWFAAQRARLDLLEKYHGQIEKALSSVRAGQFLQIENQIGIFIDVVIAGEMPLVGQKE